MAVRGRLLKGLEEEEADIPKVSWRVGLTALVKLD